LSVQDQGSPAMYSFTEEEEKINIEKAKMQKTKQSKRS
jgi:hypothetical protein